MNSSRLFFHNLENAFKKMFIKLLFKGSDIISPEQIDLAKIKKILVVRQHDPMGDVLISTAIIPNLGKAFPGARVDVIARPALSEKDIFMNSPIINEVIVFDKKKFFSPLKIFKFLKKLKRVEYDLAIVAGSTSVSFTSLILAYLSKAKIRAGYDGEYFAQKLYTDIFLTTPVPYDSAVIKHQAIRNTDILAYLKIPVTNNEHYMYITEKEKEEAKVRIGRKGISVTDHTIVGIHLGANEIPNRWPVEKFAKITDILCEKNAKVRVIIFTGPREKHLAEAFKKLAKTDVYIQEVLPLRQFASILSLLDIFICNDTGVLHVGAAVGTKTIAIFGPTDPGQWNPLGKTHLWVRNDDHTASSIKTVEVLEKVREFRPDIIVK